MVAINTAIITAAFAIVITIMVIWLIKSLRSSLYRYTNVALIGGIFFLSAYCVTVIVYLFNCLKGNSNPSLSYILKQFIEFPESFALVALPVLGIISISIIVSNLALIRHEGKRLKNILGVFFGGLYIGVSLAVYLVSHYLEEHVFYPGGYMDNPKFVAAYMMVNTLILLIICYFECIFLGTVVMGYITAKHKPSYNNDFIIILGCSIKKDGGLLPLLKGRANRAIRYAWEQEIATGKPILYVPSGGKGSDEIMSEGSALELYLLSHGAEDYEVFPEKESANTYENFLFSKRIIDAQKSHAKVVFATTNYHIFRSGMLARRVGLDAEGIASDTKWYFWPNGFLREFFAILSMKMRTHIAVVTVLTIMCALLGQLYYLVEM